MQFLHVTDSEKDLDTVNKYITDGKHVFLFIHSESCGHCIHAFPHWKRLQNRLAHKNRPDVLVADINQKILSEVNKIVNVGTIEGYPTIKYIYGKKVNEFDKERTTDLFMNWIETNIGNAVSMNNKTRRGQRGGKISDRKRSYHKRSDCKRSDCKQCNHKRSNCKRSDCKRSDCKQCKQCNRSIRKRK